MRIAVNGEPRNVAEDATIADVVTAMSAAPSGVAVALNGEVVSRGQWANERLNEADRIEVLSATPGG